MAHYLNAAHTIQIPLLPIVLKYSNYIEIYHWTK